MYGDTAGAGAVGGGGREWTGADRVKAAAGLMAGWIALLWVLEAVDLLTLHALDPYGISPREAAELRDIVPAAFLHFGFGHLAANTVPLLVFGFLAAVDGIRRFLAVAAMIVVVDGLGVWLVAPAYSNTAGASGLIFGLFGYLVVRGFVDRKALDIGVGLALFLIWGSTILLGLSPAQTDVSWQGHLFGLVAGVAAAFVFRRRRPGRAAIPG
ncbi:rhomboid family intramembrane serine protease [Streptomyces sp. MUM 203J]|uniref:rhomboid family intramembrane serine protease n=1 Tax=Streptomyces sp. MUM 203J TaxID=2791990 RepID=UPI001F03544F|nr:rhomboid family intramembrane serine protease [Streptomyces sp. MUM 203J]MCH0541402.1 rhomboid family intramembrane serine protease [Streptomyces sp. MUM 203J]